MAFYVLEKDELIVMGIDDNRRMLWEMDPMHTNFGVEDFSRGICEGFTVILIGEV